MRIIDLRALHFGDCVSHAFERIETSSPWRIARDAPLRRPRPRFPTAGGRSIRRPSTQRSATSPSAVLRAARENATNRRAFAVARQLGWGSRDARRPQSNDRGGVAAASQQQRRGADAARAPNHAQRRSAARSARHHAERAAAGPAAAPAVATPAPPLRMADTDVLMGDERPSSPSRAAREEYALLADASDALAARQPRVQRGSYSYADSATGHAAPGRSI